MPIAEFADDVVALEGSKQAVGDMRRNLESNQVWAEIAGGDAARTLPELGEFDAVLVDPPRTGLAEPVLQRIAQMRPAALVYVSCDPTTLARDIRALVKSGFQLKSARPFDLFPQTYHVESVALLTSE